MVSVDTMPSFLRGKRPTQVALLVPDLAQAVDEWKLLGFDDWSVYTYSEENVPTLHYRGSPARFAFRLAMARTPIQFELVQPLYGQSIYTDWIEEHGYGLHHLGFHIESIADGMTQMAAEGYQPIQSGFGYGLDGNGGFAYYDVPVFGRSVVELIEAPTRRRPSETLEQDSNES